MQIIVIFAIVSCVIVTALSWPVIYRASKRPANGEYGQLAHFERSIKTMQDRLKKPL